MIKSDTIKKCHNFVHLQKTLYIHTPTVMLRLLRGTYIQWGIPEDCCKVKTNINQNLLHWIAMFSVLSALTHYCFLTSVIVRCTENHKTTRSLYQSTLVLSCNAVNGGGIGYFRSENHDTWHKNFLFMASSTVHHAWKIESHQNVELSWSKLLFHNTFKILFA